SATLVIAPNASTKFANRYSRCSLPASTVQPGSCASRRAISSVSSFVFAMGPYTAASGSGTSGLPPAAALREHLARMNLLLVDPEELGGDGTCVVRDHRALHLRSVIGVRAGWHVRAGVVGGGIGSAEIKADDGVAITLRLKLTEPAPLPLPIELELAVP